MYLYTIPQTPNKNAKKILSKQTKLNRHHATKLKANKTKKLNRAEIDGGFLGIDLCKWGRCHMPKPIYKATKAELTPHFLKLFNITKDNDVYKTKYEKIIESGLDDGLLRGFLHGVYAKMGHNRKYLESAEHKYLDYIKIFIKLLILSGMPDGYTYTFPNSYKKHNSEGKQIDETGTETNTSIKVDRTTISGDVLLSYIERILRADKENLQVNKLLQKSQTLKEYNTFIFSDTLNTAITPDKTKDYTLNQILYFYNPTSCTINERGNVQSTENCKVVFTFNTKQSVSLSDREVTKNDFTYVESNLKQIRAYFLSLAGTTDKGKVKRYTQKLIMLLTDSYKIKHYVDGCIKFFAFMEKFKATTAQPGLFQKYIM
jgi:hypothetical protein